MMPALFNKSMSLVFLALLVLVAIPGKVQATNSCTASVSPSSIQANSQNNLFTFSVTNTGDEVVDFIQLFVPTSNFILGSDLVSGWSVSSNAELAYLSSGTLAVDASTNFQFYVNGGPIEVPSADWGIAVTSTGDGIACTGSLGTAISGAVDNVVPQISSISVSSITSSSVVIGWSTNEVADSFVGYGTDPANTNSTASDASLALSHSITLTGLSTGTTYYYYVKSTDGSGNFNTSGENSFTTAAVETTTIIVAPTPAPVTTSVTKTVTKTVILKDTTKPVITVSTELEGKVYEQAPVVEGRASDKSGIVKLEYSIDNGVNYLVVEEFVGGGSVNYAFVPSIFDDGNYEFRVRATDGVGNVGVSEAQTLIIDRLPPLVGGSLLSMGPFLLVPNEYGMLVTMAGIEQRITLSAVGGPTMMDLFVDKVMYSLPRSVETGLWSGTVNFKKPGLYKMNTKAVDGAGNKTERALNSVLVLKPGRVLGASTGQAVKEGVVTLYYKDTVSKIWTQWDGKPFGQDNPQIIGDSGEYQYFLPPGTYYLQVKATGYKNLTSKIFKLNKTTPVNATFELSETKGIKIGRWTLSWPDLFSTRADVKLNLPNFNKMDSEDSLIDKEAPIFRLPTTDGSFDLTDSRGKPIVLSFINSWSPASVEQMLVLSGLANEERFKVVAVAVQETSSKISIFRKRGGYEVPIVIDQDGELVEAYELSSLPTHYFLDRKGVVKKVVKGVLNNNEIVDVFLNLLDRN